MSEELNITIKSSVDKKYEFTVLSSLTVAELKDKIAAESDVPALSQRLIYSGRVLKDNDTLESYKIKTGHTIHLVKSAGARSSNPANSTSNNTTPSSNSTSISTPNNNPQVTPSNISTGRGSFNPLADLTGARYAGFTQLPSQDTFGPDGGLQLPNEEDMDRMLDNPMFQQGLNEMLSNPQMVDYMINQNPQLRSMGPMAREMLQSPQFRQMLTNPETRRQMRDMQRLFGGGAASQQSSFPAPGGGEESTDDTNANPTSNTGSDTNTAAASSGNPFAQLFPGGSPFGNGANPFAAFANAANGQQGGLPQIDPSVLQSILGGGAFGGSESQQQQQDTRPPEERYESQLRQLNDMGFSDFDANVRALRRSGGSVQGAVENLLNGI